MTKSKYEFYQQSSLSQKLAHKDSMYSKLAGIDRELSDSIGTLLILGEFGFIDLDNPNVALVLALLDVQRKAAFATSEKTDQITKMGFQLPKAADVVDFSE